MTAETILAFFGLWFLVSIPFGILLGRFVAAGDLTDYVIVPRDGGEQ